MLNPIVSIIIPVYNAENYIAATIQSAISQTWPNKELLIIDDGSTDNSLGIIEGLKNDSVKIFRQNHKGASAARNYGITEAKGKYIQFLDSDDLLSQNKIYEQVTLLEANNNTIAVCSTIHFYNEDKLESLRPSFYEDSFLVDANPLSFLLNLYGAFGKGGSMVQPNAWLTPKSIIDKAGPWDEQLTLDDDGEYFCRVLLCAHGVKKSQGFNYYRKHKLLGNLSALKEKVHLQSQYKALKSKIEQLSLHTEMNAEIVTLYARWLHDLMFTAYPNHPELVKTVENELKNNICYSPKSLPFATTSGKLLSRLVGWKIAKCLQVLKHTIFG